MKFNVHKLNPLGLGLNIFSSKTMKTDVLYVWYEYGT